MIEKNTGGAAFPRPFSTSPGAISQFGKQDGMTMLDWFAGQALVGLFAMEANPRMGDTVAPFDITKHSEQMAQMAYELAGAMLRARGDA